LRATAYIAWAVFDDSPAKAGLTREFLLKHTPESITDPYVLALVCNAFMVIDPKGESANAKPYLTRLTAIKHNSPDGRLTWWELPPGSVTAFYGAGDCGNVETTALAALALIKSGTDPAAARGALAWLAERRGAQGHWGSTQATVLALKALVTGSGKPAGDKRLIDIALDGQTVQTIDIPADQAEVMKQIDLSTLLKAGSNKLTIRDRNDGGTAFQVAFRYHVPGDEPIPAREPLTIDVKYERDRLTVDQPLTVTATIVNRTDRVAPMVMVDLPIPAGFSLDGEPKSGPPPQAEDAPGPGPGLPPLGASTPFERHEVTPRQLIIYLRELAPNRPLVISYRLKATVAADVTVPAGRVYEYYDPEKAGRGKPSRLTVTAKPNQP
jgi:uncharacterized protein YfaS (alpha-2-macroglobulin family)